MKSIEDIINAILAKITELKTMNYLSSILVQDENGHGIHLTESMLSSINFDKTKLIKKYEDLEKYYNDNKSFVTSNKEVINEHYYTYLSRKLNSDLHIYTKIINLSKSKTFSNLQDFFDEYYYQILSIDTHKEILELFAIGTINRVVFGKNGSGKTKLLNKIRKDYVKSTTNIYVIPSSRAIESGNTDNLTISSINNINLETLLISNHSYYNGYPNDFLTMLLYNINYRDLENDNSVTTNGEKQGALLNKVITIYNSLSTTRKLKFNSSNYCFQLYNNENNINPYNISEGSDGERAIFQIISYALLCPTNSYLLIDEPENHLNTALLKNLFDILECERKDIMFIYFSHDIEFIESRNNVKYVYLDNYDGNNWEVQQIDSFNDIPIDIIIKIIGSKNDILFIEGELNNLDYRLYSLLFPNKNVIPVGSCENVISHCKSLKKINFIYQNIEGIVDYDFRDQDEINSIAKDGVHVLDYNEVENVLLSNEIVDLFFYNTPALKGKENEFKNNIITKLTKEKNVVFQDYLRKYYTHRLQFPKLAYNSDYSLIEKQVISATKTSISDLLTNLKEFEAEFDKTISESDYDTIIKRYPNKGLISNISSFDIKPVFYYETVFALLKNNPEKCEIIKKSIFKKET